MSKTPRNIALITHGQRRPQNPIEGVAKKNNVAAAANRKPKEAGEESKAAADGAGKPVRKRPVLKKWSVEVSTRTRSTQASTQTGTHASTQTTTAKKPKQKLAKTSPLATTTAMSLIKPANPALNKQAVAGNKADNRNKIKNGVAATKRVLQPILEGNQQLESSSSQPPVKIKAKMKTTASAVNESQKKSKRAFKKKVKVEIKE